MNDKQAQDLLAACGAVSAIADIAMEQVGSGYVMNWLYRKLKADGYRKAADKLIAIHAR